MDHPSDEQMTKFISCPITVQDLKNLRAIKGPCAQCLEGKPNFNKESNSANDSVEPTAPGEMLHCEIVFIMGKPRLFTTDHVSGYCTFTVMETKSTQRVQKAFEEVINAYQGYLKVVRYISVDAESVLQVCEDFLKSRGVRMLARIPGEHESMQSVL